MNPNHIKLAKTLLFAVVGAELVVGRINAKRCNRNAEKIRILREENERLVEAGNAAIHRANYLIDILQRTETGVSEFDLIVINSLTQQ